VEEHVRLMRVLWTEEVGAFEGEFVRVSPSWSWPKPMQRPHPPVLLGVRASARNFDRIASWADGWVPMGTPEFAHGVFADQVGELRARWAGAGRPPEALHIQVQLSGRPFSELAALAGQAYELGAGRVLLRVGDMAAEASLNRLDALAEVFARRFG
jgi:alkanesulfonate monooxygenase SsuD/methylene tetrahydromethanopterin reductase-like flavin-dependent oxidoreductase (luciferase family)